jgi:hypothetical protein
VLRRAPALNAHPLTAARAPCCIPADAAARNLGGGDDGEVGDGKGTADAAGRAVHAHRPRLRAHRARLRRQRAPVAAGNLDVRGA